MNPPWYGSLPSPMDVAANKPVSCLAWSPDSRLLAAAMPSAVAVWRRSGAGFHAFPDGVGVTTLCFSLDGGRLFALTHSEVIAWDICSLSPLFHVPSLFGDCSCLGFSPACGAMIFTSTEGEFVGNVFDENMKRMFNVARLKEEGGAVPVMAAFSPNAERLAMILRGDFSEILAVWTCLGRLGEAHPLYRCNFSCQLQVFSWAPDSRRIAVSSFSAHLFVVDLEALSPVDALDPREIGTDTALGVRRKCEYVLSSSMFVSGWAKSGDTLYGVSPDTLHGVSPDTLYGVSLDHGIILFRNSSDGEFARKVEVPPAPPLNFNRKLRLASLSPDGEAIAVLVEQNSRVHLQDLTPPPQQLPPPHVLVLGERVVPSHASAWSADSSLLLLVRRSGASSASSSSSAAFATQATQASAAFATQASGGQVDVLDVMAMTITRSCSFGASAGRVLSAAFSTDGDHVLVLTDSAVRVWSAPTNVIDDEAAAQGAWAQWTLHAMKETSPSKVAVFVVGKKSLGASAGAGEVRDGRQKLVCSVFSAEEPCVVLSAAFSDDGSKLGASLCYANRARFVLWDTSKANVERPASAVFVLSTETLNTFSFGPSGAWLVVNERGSSYVVDLNICSRVSRMNALKDEVFTLGTAVAAGKCKYVISPESQAKSVEFTGAWSRDGAFMCCRWSKSADEAKLQLRRTADFSLHRELPLRGSAISSRARPVAMFQNGAAVVCIGTNHVSAAVLQ